MYDFVAGKQKLKSSYYLSKKKALEKFPMLKKEALKGALVYYDGLYYVDKNLLSVLWMRELVASVCCQLKIDLLNIKSIDKR